MKKIYLAGLALVFLGSTVGVRAQSLDRQSLKGLHGVGIWIRISPATKDDLDKLGISLTTIYEQVTLKLRKEGIPVLEAAEQEKQSNTWAQGWPHLAVDVDYFNRQDVNLAVLSMSIRIEQWVTLTRMNTDKAMLAITWESGASTVSGSNTQLRQSAKEMVNEITDKFINAYLAENPKANQ